LAQDGPTKIERLIDVQSVEDDEDVDEDEDAEDESVADLKPVAIRAFSKLTRLSTSVQKPWSTATSSSSSLSSATASDASEANKYFIRGQLQPWLATRISRVQAEITMDSGRDAPEI